MSCARSYKKTSLDLEGRKLLKLIPVFHSTIPFHCSIPLFQLIPDSQAKGSLQSLDWNGGMEWWNGIMECVLQGERSLLMQFSMKVTVGVLFLIGFVR